MNAPIPAKSPLVLAIVLLLGLLTHHAQAALFSKNSPVVQLSSSNFRKQVLDIEKPTLVAFTAPWCGHCQRLVPEYDRAARSLEGIIKFANIDCYAEANKATCGRYGVQGFPTIKLFPPTAKRLPRDYRGERTAKALVEYAVDALPRSVKKVNAEDLQSFVSRNPSQPKVLLFSNKATSSPLYKSLALDFRTSMTFAFARGDQAPVQSAARVNLGVNIKGESDLPVLVLFPPREASEDFVKGSFETYEGKLKYGLLKAWLDGLHKTFDVKQDKGEQRVADDGKSQRKPKAKAKAKKVPATGTDSSDEPLPEGGAYEWKPPPSQQQRESAESAPMLSKERASKLAEEIKAQQEALKKKPKGQPGNAESLAFGERHKYEAEGREQQVVMKASTDSAPAPAPEDEASPSDTASKETSEDPFADPEKFKDHVNEGAYIYSDSQTADLHVINQVLEEAGAYQAVDAAINRVGDAAQNARKSAAETYKNVKKAADSIASKFGVTDLSEDTVDPERQPFIAKRRALLGSFEKWLAGENPEWQETYGDEFMRATKDVEELIASDPAKAEELAWENEEWLLGELKIDREKMQDVIGEVKKANLDEMIDLIQTRLKTRGEERVQRGEQGSVDAAVEAVLRKAEEERLQREGTPRASTSHHDEL